MDLACWTDFTDNEVVIEACDDPEIVRIMMEQEATCALTLVAALSRDPAVLMLCAGWQSADTLNAVADNHSAPEESLRLAFEQAVRWFGSVEAASCVTGPLLSNPSCPADVRARIEQEIAR